MNFDRKLTRRDFVKTLFFGGVAFVFMRSLLSKKGNQKQTEPSSISLRITAFPVKDENVNIGETK